MQNKIFTQINAPIKDIIIQDRGRKDLGNLKELKYSIETSGLINPILITKDYKLIAGERRLTVCKELGWEFIDARISPDVSPDDLIMIEMMENVARKDFTWQEELELKSKLHNYWKEEAKKTKTPWGIRESAKKFNCASGGLSTDLSLAKAIETIPELKNYETKAQAKNTFKKLGDSAVALKAMDNMLPEEQQRIQNMLTGNITIMKDENEKVKVSCPKSLHEDTCPDVSDLSFGSTVEQPLGEKQTRQTYEAAYSVENYATFLAKIPDNSVGLVELDPPYAIDFENTYGKNTKTASKATDWTIEQLYDFYNTQLPIIYKKLLPNSWVLCWTGKEHAFPTNAIAKSVGFKTQEPGIWAKPGGSSNSPSTNMISNYEMFLLFRKEDATFNIPSFPSVINFNSPSGVERIHQWEKPLDMYHHFLTALGKQGSIALSLFAGSGNFLIASAAARMIPMGCDKSQRYIHSFYARFNKLLNS